MDCKLFDGHVVLRLEQVHRGLRVLHHQWSLRVADEVKLVSGGAGADLASLHWPDAFAASHEAALEARRQAGLPAEGPLPQVELAVAADGTAVSSRLIYLAQVLSGMDRIEIRLDAQSLELVSRRLLNPSVRGSRGSPVPAAGPIRESQ